MKRLSLTALALCALVACGERSTSGPVLDLRLTRAPAIDDPAIATFADDQLTTSQLQERLAALPPAQRNVDALPGGRRALVDRIAHFELLAREAARRDLHNDPEIVTATKRLMVQKLLEQEHAKVAEGITEQDLEVWYQAHRSDFQRPARVRVFHLFLSRKEAGGEAALRARADAVRARAQAFTPRDREAFAALVRQESHDLHSRALDGDLRFRSHEELRRSHGPDLADAAFALERPGALSGWIADPNGLHLLRLEAREPALALSLQQPDVRARVAQTVRTARERDAERSLLQALSERAGYRVDEAALEALPLDVHPVPAHRRPGGVDGGPTAPVSPDAIAR